MKHLKRILAFALTLVMAFAMSPLAFAADHDFLGEDVEKTITATNVKEGDTVVYYQVVGWDAAEGWVLKDPFKSIKGLTVGALTAENGITDDIAASIAEAATGAGTAMTPGNGTDYPKTTFTATNVDPGLYYLKATATTSIDTVYNPAFVSADYYEGGNTVDFSSTLTGTAVLKSSTITLDKDVNSTDEFKTTKPGDIIPYIITTKVPSYGDTFRNPTFSITDTFSAGLALELDTVDEVEHPITVTYGDKKTTVSNNDVTITATDGGSTFTVAFTNDYLTRLAGVQPDVEITYFGVVTTDAANNVTYMDNEAVLTYSNSPTTTRTKEDITRHYTFTIDGSLLGESGVTTDELLKIGVDANNQPITQTTTTHHTKDVSPLGGAVFSLTPVEPTTMNEPNPRTATSSDDGYITFVGLDAGEYQLVETSAPAGFIKDNRIFTVKIIPHWNETTPDLLDSYDVVFSDGTNPDVKAEFVMNNTGETIKSLMPTTGLFVNNTRGTELPSTGGIGTTIFYIVGGVMVAGAVIFLLTKRRVAGAGE